MKLDVQRASEIDLGKGDVICPQSRIQVAASCPVPVGSNDREFAERDEYQSGQRFLNGSAPRLKRHVAFCETAAGDAKSPAAGKDQKPFRGLGQRPISAEGAVPLPLLDQADVAKLSEFFLLLDAWDRRRNDSPLL